MTSHDHDKAPQPPEPERRPDDADVRGEHRYPRDRETDAERRAREEREALKRRLNER
jgi:hypothetical protein